MGGPNLPLSLTVETGASSLTPEFRVLTRAILFDGVYASWPNHAAYDVHPDGRRFVMIEQAEEVSVVVVVNWAAELGRLTAPEP